MSGLGEAFALVRVARTTWEVTTEGVSVSKSYEDWRRVHREADTALRASLEAAGAVVRDGGGAAVVAVKLYGIQSSSTCGLHGAVSNWLRNASAKLGEARP